MSSDAYHMTAPCEDGDGAMRCMKTALKNARMNPDEVDYLNAHARRLRWVMSPKQLPSNVYLATTLTSWLSARPNR